MKPLAGFLLAISLPASAGLYFKPAPGPLGADTAALVADGTTLWAGTSHGIYRNASGVWQLDGLGEESIRSLAVSDGALWAATGNRLYRRLADGTYALESLPGVSPFPTVLVADGSTLYVGGLGVFRRSGGTYSTLPSPGPGFITAGTLAEGNLVVGLSSGGAARFSNGVFTRLTAGMPGGESPTTLAFSGGTLFAGTARTLYSWNGTSWVADATFGVHEVAALAETSGVLRAGTLDAGVLRRSGSTWERENGGLSVLSVRAFALRGADIYAGARGGPVYRLAGGSWQVEGESLSAVTISDLSFDRRSPSCGAPNGGLLVATRGSGVRYLAGPSLAACPVASDLSVPAGCGDVPTALLANGSSSFPASSDFLAATNCGPFFGAELGSGQFVATGLPPRVGLTSTTNSPLGIVAGTESAGIYRFSGTAWSSDNAGLSPFAAVTTVRTLGDTLYAALDSGLFRRGPTGTWLSASPGLPQAAQVQALGGTSPIFAGLAAGGVYRRDGSPSSTGNPWRPDSQGLNVPPVSSLEISSRRLFAAAGRSLVAMKRDGAWGSETFGFPTGAEVRVLRDWQYPEYGATPFPPQALFAGTAGHGLFVAASAPSVRVVPVVLDVVGQGGARFRSELTLGNRSGSAVTLAMTFQPAPNFGASTVERRTVTRVLQPNAELRIADALEFLRASGIAIPPASPGTPIAGSLAISAATVTSGLPATDDVYAITRTYTGSRSTGTFGLFYDAPSDIDAAEQEASVYGLRSISGIARSNLAVVHVPGRSPDSITLEVEVFAASGLSAGTLPPITLDPGEWHQIDKVLTVAGLPDGSYGYVRIRRVAGIGPWIAYGVVNDDRTSDGSYVPAFRPGGLAAARRLVVPVVLDVYGAAGSHFTTELTLVNNSTIKTPVDLVYRPAPDFGEAPGVPVVTRELEPREQVTIPDIVQYLREKGVQIPDPLIGGPQAGTLSVDFRFLRSLDAPETVALARTSTQNPNTTVGGTFGTFYAAAARGGGVRTKAVIPSLTQNASVRSNLAVVHLGGGSELPIEVELRLYRAADGAPAGNPLRRTLQPGDWFQWSGVIQQAGALADGSEMVGVVTRLSGDDTFFAYGVLNDATTSDGSYLKMIVADDF